MTPAAFTTFFDAEARNDEFALEHDIDEYYERSSIFIRYIEAARLRCIARMLRACATDRILEVGCGGGHILRLFPYSNLTGVDVSGRMLDKARENLRGYRVQLLKGDLSGLGLSDGGFDKIICSEVLEHVADPRAILLEIRRLLAPNGRVVVTFPNDHLIHRIKCFLRMTGMDRLPFCGRTAWGGDDYHMHVWSISEMRELLARYFRIKQEYGVPGRCFPVRCCFQCEAKESM
jgi:SAM-dependent methyltransferase